MAYRHLALEERFYIYALRKAEFSLRQIASELGRACSTISRELQRNRGCGYRPLKAHTRARKRAVRFRTRVRIQPTQWCIIEALLRQDWSPEQIAKRARLEQTLRVSHEWIYRHIYTDSVAGGELWRTLRHQKQTSRGIPSAYTTARIPRCARESLPVRLNAFFTLMAPLTICFV